MSHEAPSTTSNEKPSSVAVLDDFATRREELAKFDQYLNVPRPQQKAEHDVYKKEITALEQLNKDWSNYGGEAIDAAQEAVSNLDFSSSPEDRIKANGALTAAKNAFYENYLLANYEDTGSADQSKELILPDLPQLPAELAAPIDDKPNPDFDPLAARLAGGWKVDEALDNGTYKVSRAFDKGSVTSEYRYLTADEIAAMPTQDPAELEALAKDAAERGEKDDGYTNEEKDDALKDVFALLNAPETGKSTEITVNAPASEPEKIAVKKSFGSKVVRYLTDPYYGNGALINVIKKNAPKAKEAVKKGIEWAQSPETDGIAVKKFGELIERGKTANKNRAERRQTKRDLRNEARAEAGANDDALEAKLEEERQAIRDKFDADANKLLDEAFKRAGQLSKKGEAKADAHNGLTKRQKLSVNVGRAIRLLTRQ